MYDFKKVCIAHSFHKKLWDYVSMNLTKDGWNDNFLPQIHNRCFACEFAKLHSRSTSYEQMCKFCLLEWNEPKRKYLFCKEKFYTYKAGSSIEILRKNAISIRNLELSNYAKSII